MNSLTLMQGYSCWLQTIVFIYTDSAARTPDIMAPCVACRSCYDGDPCHTKDSAWAWIVCLAASMNLAFTVGLIYSFGVLLPVFMDYFKENRERTGKTSPKEIVIAYRI